MVVLNCICGHRIEGADDAALFDAIRAHSDQVHPHMSITDDQIRDSLALRARLTPWDGEQMRLHSALEIRPLGPERLDDFLRFFDRDAFMDNPFWANCYCMEPHLLPEQFEQYPSEQRREAKGAYPPKRAVSDARAFRGTVEMYRAAGFEPYRERQRSVILRRFLSGMSAG